MEWERVKNLLLDADLNFKMAKESQEDQPRALYTIEELINNQDEKE